MLLCSKGIFFSVPCAESGLLAAWERKWTVNLQGSKENKIKNI
jgi:hypothetical protein